MCAALRKTAPKYSNFGSTELAELHSELKAARDRFDLQGDRVRIRYAQNFHGIPRQPGLGDDVPPVLFHSAAKNESLRPLEVGLKAQRGSTLPLATSVDDAQRRSRPTRDEETVYIVDTVASRDRGVCSGW